MSNERPVGPTIDLWIETSNYADTTLRVKRYIVANFRDFVGGDRPIYDINHHDVSMWVGSLDHLRPSTIRHHISTMRAFFGWCIRRRWLYDSPMDEIHPPKVTNVKYRALDRETIDRLLYVADFRERTMILTGLHLGLRCCEMSRAEVPDWSRHQSTLDVRGKGYSGEVSRVLPIVGEVEWALDLWVGDRRTGPLFPSMHADRLTANSISQIVTKVAKRAGVRASAHMLRHSAAHDLVAGGATLATVQRFLGHTSLQSTTRYLAANDEQLREAMTRTYLLGPR